MCTCQCVVCLPFTCLPNCQGFIFISPITRARSKWLTELPERSSARDLSQHCLRGHVGIGLQMDHRNKGLSSETRNESKTIKSNFPEHRPSLKERELSYHPSPFLSPSTFGLIHRKSLFLCWMKLVKYWHFPVVPTNAFRKALTFASRGKWGAEMGMCVEGGGLGEGSTGVLLGN